MRCLLCVASVLLALSGPVACLAGTAEQPPAAGTAAGPRDSQGQAATKARPARPRRAFVPIDLKKLFTAGPLSDPRPPSTLLPAETTTVELKLTAASPTVCRYSVGKDLPYDRMTPFDLATASTAPRTVLRGLDPDPGHLNDVFIRPATEPSAVLQLQYRCLPSPRPSFPRTANLWGSGHFLAGHMDHAARIDLWLGVHARPEQLRQLRTLNPSCFILTDINTVENNDVPEDYFLRDTTGRKIEVWPGAYRLNLTRPEVAEYQARYAYQRMLESHLMYDGCFFDNFMMTQSWLTHDIYDRPVQLDGDGDGKPDAKDAFDRAWRAGIFRELRTWRTFMPWALTTGHSQGYPHPDIAAIFNGQGIGFYTTDVIEGKMPFHELWDYYHAWCSVTRKPAITSVESAVPDQIAYGYDYTPQRHMPRSTWDFARDYYPYMRFGLAFTLMNDGYFSHELGDTDHGQDWWYDELDFKLGDPLGPAHAVVVGQASDHELVLNGGFESELNDTWSVWCDRSAGCAATADRDTSNPHQGTLSARITITSPGHRGGIEFTQRSRSLVQGKAYDLKFWARADQPQEIACMTSQGSAPWHGYGLNRDVRLTPSWQPFTLTFEASRTAADARIQFLCGGERGSIWLDDVSLREHSDEVQRRDFRNGIVLLNGARHRQTVDVGDGFARIQGTQAPRHQSILDDTTGSGFATAGSWRSVALGTKEWHAIAPYYHAWNNHCHTLEGGSGEARWQLDLPAPGTYTIQAWWAAAPEATGWSKQAVYEIVAAGQVVARTTCDQTASGDTWHTLAENLKLDPAQQPFVRLRSAGSGTLVADALHLFSSERYNDGSVARQVTLEPMDGIILRRAGGASR